MLEVHNSKVKDIYELPSRSNLSYNDESTQICVDKIPLYKHLSRKLFDPYFTEKLTKIRKHRKNRLLNAHNNPSEFNSKELFNLQFDYELIGLDHLVNPKNVRNICSRISSKYERSLAEDILLTPSSGKTFFEEVVIKELEVIGNLLRNKSDICEKSFFFENKFWGELDDK